MKRLRRTYPEGARRLTIGDRVEFRGVDKSRNLEYDVGTVVAIAPSGGVHVSWDRAGFTHLEDPSYLRARNRVKVCSLSQWRKP